jgi:hypothetical protein
MDDESHLLAGGPFLSYWLTVPAGGVETRRGHRLTATTILDVNFERAPRPMARSRTDATFDKGRTRYRA